MSRTIAFFGSSLVSAYWNGAATYYRGIVRALAAEGFSVTFYEPDAGGRQKHRDIPDPPWAEVVVYSGKDPAAPMAMLDHARRADVLVKASGVGVFDELLEREILSARRPGALAVFWDVDPAATLERMRSDDDDPFRALVPRYDLVLTYGGGPPVVREYEDLGAKRCIPVYDALDPETHFPVAAEPRLSAELSLLANRLPDREKRIDEFFFEAARRAPEKRFLLGGAGWEDKPLPPNVSAVGDVCARDHNTFNASALSVLNVAGDGTTKTGWSPGTRIFEAAGAGACIITDSWRGMPEFLEPGHEILVADDGEGVARIVRELRPALAARIGAAARARVLAEHTYAARGRQVASIFGGAS
jgi:spore maturation protein CgeB